MKAVFYGGANEVGRSCINLTGRDKQLMLDAGIMLGREIQYPVISEDEIKKIKNVVVTHAHLDHAGYLPHMVQTNREYDIYGTKPTRDLMHLLLADYQRLQKTKDFSAKDVDHVVQRMKQVEYHEQVNPAGGFSFSLFNAGHVIGSSMVLVRNGNKKVLYTGDINMRETKLLDQCETGIRADTLIMESTYGGRADKHPSLKILYKQLTDEIKDTLKKGGWVLIPSFAVGRGQEILLTLDSYMRSGAIPEVPIYIDGMINSANRIHRHNVIYARRELQLMILMSDEDPFKSKRFHVPKTKSRGDVFEQQGIIVTTSGMLSGGPVLSYLAKMSGNKNNKLLIVGYQAEGTLGRRLLSGEKEFRIKDKTYPMEMETVSLPISGHSDHDGLIRFVQSMKGLKKIVLVHGERDKMHSFADALSNKMKGVEVLVPNNGDEISI